MDSGNLESGDRLHQDQRRLRPLLRGTFFRAFSRCGRSSFRGRIQPDSPTRMSRPAEALETSPAHFRQLDERSLSQGNPERLYPQSVRRDGKCRPARISGAYQAKFADERLCESAIPGSSRARAHLARSLHRKRINNESSASHEADQRLRALRLVRTLAGSAGFARRCRHSLGYSWRRKRTGGTPDQSGMAARVARPVSEAEDGFFLQAVGRTHSQVRRQSP